MQCACAKECGPAAVRAAVHDGCRERPTSTTPVRPKMQAFHARRRHACTWRMSRGPERPVKAPPKRPVPPAGATQQERFLPGQDQFRCTTSAPPAQSPPQPVCSPMSRQRRPLAAKPTIQASERVGHPAIDPPGAVLPTARKGAAAGGKGRVASSFSAAPRTAFLSPRAFIGERLGVAGPVGLSPTRDQSSSRAGPAATTEIHQSALSHHLPSSSSCTSRSECSQVGRGQRLCRAGFAVRALVRDTAQPP